ncbi:MAG: acyl-CoA dehydrogenase family protein, partial [Rhodospirillaceae bacterium]|nr:acyl-CoA dehydrogenase family protein [Rhodospirillaceae bacterium]
MFELTEEQIAIRDMTRDFVRTDVTPFALEWDAAAAVSKEAVAKAGSLGLFGVTMP